MACILLQKDPAYAQHKLLHIYIHVKYNKIYKTYSNTALWLH